MLSANITLKTATLVLLFVKKTLVARGKKAFGQLMPPLPKYQGTYDVKIVLRLIENLGENKILTMKQLSLETVLSTLSRCCFVL